MMQVRPLPGVVESVITIVKVSLYNGPSRGDSTVLCQGLARRSAVLALISMTHPLEDTQIKRKGINEVKAPRIDYITIFAQFIAVC